MELLDLLSIIKTNQMETVIKAFNFAAVAHKDQRRKDSTKTPYINHPIEVCDLLSSVGKITQLETLCAAVLHDTVEDTSVTLEDIEKEFGPVVREIVALCSDNKSLHKAERKRLQLAHAIEMFEKPKYVDIPNSFGINVHAAAILVKLADKYSNCCQLASNPPSDWSMDTITGYALWSYAIVSEVRGVNDNMDKLFDELFEEFHKKWNIDFKNLSAQDLDAKLEAYYNSL